MQGKEIFNMMDWDEYLAIRDRFEAASFIAAEYIVGDSGGYLEKMTEEQRKAEVAVSGMICEFGKLKDLFYHALKTQPDSAHLIDGVYQALMDEIRCTAANDM